MRMREGDLWMLTLGILIIISFWSYVIWVQYQRKIIFGSTLYVLLLICGAFPFLVAYFFPLSNYLVISYGRELQGIRLLGLGIAMTHFYILRK